jgi:hypothetical protein
MVVVLVGVMLATGCRCARTPDESVATDPINTRFEDGTEFWRFAFGRHSGKARGYGRINDSARVAEMPLIV